MDQNAHLVDVLTQQTASMNLNTVKQMDEIIGNLGEFSFCNYYDQRKSDEAACYACCRVFLAVDVILFTDDMTALCPCCGIDSVLFDCTKLPIKDEYFLKRANEYWFTPL